MDKYKMKQPFLDENNEPIKLGVNENFEKLKALFPTIMKDGAVDFTALKEELGDIEEVSQEKYNLTWFGKQNAKKEAQVPPLGKTLNYKENGNDNFKGETENLYIEGDNLETLKLLKENYKSKIKMIYIDPPYNTGKDFVYKDNFHMTQKESDIEEGLVNEDGERLEQRYKENIKGNRYHSNWLNMMYPRLKVAHSLLKDDGVIFISIDDNEVHNLRKVCDEVFDEDNFVSNLIWQKNFAPKNDNKYISNSTESILIYAKNKSNFNRGLLPREEKHNKGYSNPDNDIRGEWSSGTILATTFSNSGVFEITAPNGIVHTPPVGRCWRYSKQKIEELISNNRLWFGKDGKGVPRVKRFLSEMPKGIVPQNLLLHTDVGSNQEGNNDLKSLLNGHFFDYPKGVKLLKRLFTIGNVTDNDIILDFFSGSATTAHAVMQLNAEDGGNRKFIMVQLQEDTRDIKKDKKGNITYKETEASKAGYKNICEIGKERIRRAGNKIVEELEEKNKKYKEENQIELSNMMLSSDDEESKAIDKDKYIKNPKALDIGFKVFEVGKTNIKWNSVENDDEYEKMEELALNEKDRLDFNPHFTDLNVVYEIALQHSGVELTNKVEKLTDIGDRTYLYANSFLICLEENITEDTIKKVSEISPQPITYYFRDSAFGVNIALKDGTKRELEELINIHYGNRKGSYTVQFI